MIGLSNAGAVCTGIITVTPSIVIGIVIGRAGAAAPAVAAGLGINEPNSEGLQLVDQLLGRHARSARRRIV